MIWIWAAVIMIVIAAAIIAVVTVVCRREMERVDREELYDATSVSLHLFLEPDGPQGAGLRGVGARHDELLSSLIPGRVHGGDEPQRAAGAP